MQTAHPDFSPDGTQLISVVNGDGTHRIVIFDVDGKAKGKQWSYPYGHEHDGKLFVVYSIGKEDCGLSVLPIASLRR